MSSQPRLTCCLTFDFDAISLWLTTFESNDSCELSRGEFSAVAVPRILDLLRKYEIRATFFVPGHTAYAYPHLVCRIRDEGHEIGHHGWVHENPADHDRFGERRVLERGFEALQKVAGVRPIGYRAPGWHFSPNTLELLLECGFLYDSSCMASDFYPYYLRRRDWWTPTGIYTFGQDTPLVEIPVSWELDDFPLFEFVWGWHRGLAPPSAVEEIWKGDFDYAYAHCPGGVYTLTLHPQVIGRGHRMLMLERLINYFRSHTGVSFQTVAAYAVSWREETPP